jgi:hypothetical protein
VNTVLHSKRPKPWRLIALGVFALIGLAAAAAMELTLKRAAHEQQGHFLAQP